MFYSSSMSSEQKKGILTRQGRPVHRQTPPNLEKKTEKQINSWEQNNDLLSSSWI